VHRAALRAARGAGSRSWHPHPRCGPLRRRSPRVAARGTRASRPRRPFRACLQISRVGCKISTWACTNAGS
jgi:hypothetical protein